MFRLYKIVTIQNSDNLYRHKIHGWQIRLTGIKKGCHVVKSDMGRVPK